MYRYETVTSYPHFDFVNFTFNFWQICTYFLTNCKKCCFLDRPEILNFSINMQNTTVVYVPIGQSANFSCKAISSPAASYHIGFRGSPTAKSIERTYLINSVKETDTGVYECVTNNGIGSAARAIVELVVVGE